MISSHVCGCFEFYMRKMCTIMLLTTYVWPLVWGWKVVDLVSLVSSTDQRLDQNVLNNLLSRSEMMDYGIQKCNHTHSKKSLVVASVVILFFSTSRMVVLENLSTNTNTHSLPFLVEGRHDM